MQPGALAGHANGGAPHSRPGAAAVLLAGLASRLSRAFAAGDLPPQLATDIARTFPGAVSISVAVPLEGQDGVLLGFSGRLQEDAAAAEPREAGEHGLALLPAAASAAGRCMAATGVVHAFAPTAGAGEQLADVLQHQRDHGAASMLLLPVPGPPPPPPPPQQQQQQQAVGAAAQAEPGSVGAAQEGAPQPSQAAGVLGIGLGPGVPARRTLVARAAYIAMALARTLDVDVTGLRQQAAGSDAAASAAASAEAVPFYPVPAAEGSPEAAAAAADAAAAEAAGVAGGASPGASSGDLDDGSDIEASTEAAVAPYMARLSPSPTLRPLQSAAATPASGAVAAPAAGDGEPSSPVTRASARRRHQRQQEQQQQEQQQQMQEAAQQWQQEEAAQQQQQGTRRRPDRPARQPAAASPEQPPADQAAAPAAPEATDVAPGPPSPPAKAKGPLLPWSKAAATAAEQQIHESGAMSAATLRFISPQREAEFGAAHAVFLAHWVDTAAQLLVVLYLALQFAAPHLFAGAATGSLLLPAAVTAAAALLRIFDPASYLQRREWVVAAVRLAWLLHSAGALAPQGGTPPPSAAATAAPSSFWDLAALAHLACADALLALSLLFPVRLQSMLLLGSASSALVVARAPLRACITHSSSVPQAACVLRLLGASLLLGTLLPAAVIYVLERSARRRWLRTRQPPIGSPPATNAAPGQTPAMVQDVS